MSREDTYGLFRYVVELADGSRHILLCFDIDHAKLRADARFGSRVRRVFREP